MVELPSLRAAQDLAERWGRFCVRFDEEAGRRPLVLPNAEHFPDPFQGDAASVGRLVRRMAGHAGLGDVPLEVVLVSEEGEAVACGTGGGCGSCAPRVQPDGSMVRLAEQGEGWRLQLAATEVGHPVALTALVARLLGRLFLMETTRPGEALEGPAEVTVELAAVRLGFGPLLLEGSHIYSKACGGPSVTSVTHLGPGELAVLTALFAVSVDARPRRLLGELSPTQRELAEQALELVRGSDEVREALQRAPERLASGLARLQEPRPWLLTLFQRRGRKSRDERLATASTLEELEALVGHQAPRPRGEAKRPEDERSARIRASVDEALQELRGDRR